FPEESYEIERYVGGLPEMIHGNVMSYEPKSMQKAIESANEKMDQKLIWIADRQVENKRRFDNTSRNQQNQQPFRRNNNVAQAYAVGSGEKPYRGTKPLCPKCNFYHDGPCQPQWHIKEFLLALSVELKVITREIARGGNLNTNVVTAVAQLEGRLTEYKEREVKYIEKIRTLEMYRASNLKCIKTLDKELEDLKLEKDGLDGKLTELLKASKNLDHLIESQRSDQVKEGVGYNAVPPPAADLYLSSKKDLSWTGLPEFVDDTVTDYSRPSPTIASTSAEDLSWTGLPEFVDDTVTDYSRPSPTIASTSAEGPEFVLNKKACYNCGDFSHLANDCRRRVQREITRSQKYAYESPSHRSVGHRSYGPSMRPSYRPIGHRPHGSAMNLRRPSMNGARPYKSFFNQTPSYETDLFLNHQQRNFPTVTRKFPTAGRKFTTGSTKNYTADMGRKEKAGSSQNNIDDKGYWNSGCSRHMTGNISYLSDFEPFNGGYVSFGQGGCKITGK
nr:hypothetical protein [Tanacetum cinerariifolium]